MAEIFDARCVICGKVDHSKSMVFPRYEGTYHVAVVHEECLDLQILVTKKGALLYQTFDVKNGTMLDAPIETDEHQLDLFNREG